MPINMTQTGGGREGKKGEQGGSRHYKSSSPSALLCSYKREKKSALQKGYRRRLSDSQRRC